MFQIETISAKMLDYYVGRIDTVIIDLRRKEQFEKSHIKGALNIPYEEPGEWQNDFTKDIYKNHLLIFYCERGGSSMKAAKYFAQQGYRTRSVIGGFQAYRGRNLVISK